MKIIPEPWIIYDTPRSGGRTHWSHGPQVCNTSLVNYASWVGQETLSTWIEVYGAWILTRSRVFVCGVGGGGDVRDGGGGDVRDGGGGNVGDGCGSDVVVMLII